MWLGAISYGVYLWHWPIFLALNGERTGWSGWRLFALRCAATVAVAAASWWLLEQPIRRWRPVIVPMLPLAACDGRHGGGGDDDWCCQSASNRPSAAGPASTPRRWSHPRCRSNCDRRPGSCPRDQGVAVFGDSVAWTLMRYLPPTPGLSFTNYTTIGCGVARGGPYRYAGETLNQKPECDAGRAGGRNGSTMTGPTSCC